MNIETPEQRREKQTSVLLDVLENFSYGEAPYMAALEHYIEMWAKARKGIIVTSERIKTIYPILREIVDEQEEIKAETERDQRRMEKREKRKQQKEGTQK